MIGKLEEDKKACWSCYLPELLLAYNATHSAVMGYSPHFLLFGRRSRIPVDYQFPTIWDLPHTTKLKQSVAEVQKRLKTAFEVVRQLTSEEAVRQQCYYNRNARAVALQPGDVVMVHTDRFVGKHKVKDQWHEGGYVIVKQLDDWPVYKVKCPRTGNQHKHTYQMLHRNRLMLVPSEDNTPHDAMHLQTAVAIILNVNIGAFLANMDSPHAESEQVLLSLLTRQNGEQTPHVWLNGEFCTKPWTQIESSSTECSSSLVEDEVSEPEPESEENAVNGLKIGRFLTILWPKTCFEGGYSVLYF